MTTLLKSELDSTIVGRTKFRRLGETETSGFPNTNPLGNSLLSPMVHLTTLDGQRPMSYGYQKMVGLLNQKNNMDIPDLPA
jgi:hypothetical protein